MSKKLPSVSSDIPRDLRNFIDRLREIIVGTGNDRFVTAKDLITSGIVASGPGGALVKPTEIVVGTPATPQNVAAAAAIQNVIVTWDSPNYTGHAYAEVWGADTDNIGVAVKLGLAPGEVYVDALGPGTSRYYWVRFVNVLSVVGPFNSVNGTLGQTGEDVTYLLETLTEAALSPTSPYSKFAVRADFFFVAPAMDFNQEATPTALATGDLWYKPSTDTTKVWNGSTWASFSTTLPFIVNTATQTINGVSVPPGVYMDAAFIKNGTITNAKIGDAAIDNAKIANLNAAKITAGYLDAARIQVGSLSADKITATNLAALSIDTGALNITGGLTLNNSGHIKGGQTAYNTGTGFFLGYSGSAYKFSIGDSTSNLTWNGSTLNIQGTGKFWNSSSPSDYVSIGLDGNGSTLRVYRTSSTLLPPLYIYDTSTSAVHSAWIYNPNGPGLQISSNTGNCLTLVGGTSNSVTEAVQLITGSRKEAQIEVRAQQQAGSSNAHSGRFKVLNGSSIRSSAICGVDAMNGLGQYYSFYSEAGVAGPFTGAHDCLILKDTVIEIGDIVVDVELIHKRDFSTTLFSVAKSTQQNQSGIGVYVGREPLHEDSTPACFLDMENTIDKGAIYDAEGTYLYNDYQASIIPKFYEVVGEYDLGIMNAIGEGQINVCGEGGDIQTGDLIVTSSMPGKGMKQSDDLVRNITVAKARETVTFSSPTEVKQIACIYMCG